FEEQKKKNAASRAEKNRREKAEKRITVLEEEIEKLKELLFGEASSDYVKAGEIQTEIDKKEEELLSLYEIVMQE
ncbi:MAG: hypothetical protein MJ078_03400, partial [Clostridia bacterium]|nr:hypothetical protein [Clostridia bacterium]